jgi:hypothetical protein
LFLVGSRYGRNAPKAVFKLAIRARFSTVEIDLHLFGKLRFVL